MGTIICKCIAFLLIISALPFYQKTKTINTAGSEKEKLIGVWGKDINGNANFQLTNDSIYYLEARYKYSVRGDSIFIYYDHWTYQGKFYFRNDSLIIRDSRENKLVRIKP